jgi:hypothetical protein
MLTYGKDSNDNVIPLLLDASGNIIVSASQLTTTGGKIKVDSSGRVTINVDEPNALNPTGIATFFANTSLPAGTSSQILYTVPASQRVRVTQSHVRYDGTVAGVRLEMIAIIGSGGAIIGQVPTVVSGSYYSFISDVLLEAGDSIQCNVYGATLNNDLYAGVAGQRYK